MKVKTSPIFYMGNKKRLIQKGLTKLFPDDINAFYDLFGGSGVVSLNISANNYILNELDSHVYTLYELLKDIKPENIIKHIEDRITEFDLPTRSMHSKKASKEDREYYKKHYMRFRDFYNKERNPLDLFVLMNYCMSQAIRFNAKGEFNMPFGSDRFIKDKHTIRYIDFHNKVNQDSFKITNKSYIEFPANGFESDDFVYLDPPYLNTTATYNENGKWDNVKQDELLDYCMELTSSNVKWAMSNVFANRGYENHELKEWCMGHSLNVYGFDGFNYSNFGKEVSNAKEVLITNY